MNHILKKILRGKLDLRPFHSVSKVLETVKFGFRVPVEFHFNALNNCMRACVFVCFRSYSSDRLQAAFKCTMDSCSTQLERRYLVGEMCWQVLRLNLQCILSLSLSCTVDCWVLHCTLYCFLLYFNVQLPGLLTCSSKYAKNGSFSRMAPFLEWLLF